MTDTKRRRRKIEKVGTTDHTNAIVLRKQQPAGAAAAAAANYDQTNDRLSYDVTSYVVFVISSSQTGFSHTTCAAAFAFRDASRKNDDDDDDIEEGR